MHMKHFFITALMLGWAAAGSAQLLSVGSVEKINLPAGMQADQAVISPDGKCVVMSTNGDRSLQRLDLTTGKAVKVTDNGSMLGLEFTDDSRSVVYRQSTTNDKHLRYTAVKATDLATGEETTVVKPTRKLNGFAVEGRDIASVENKKFRASNIDGAKAAKVPVASIYYGQLMVTVNGKTKAINPNGKEGRSYLWPSVSPDGTKVLYYLGSEGCYVCDIDGSNPVRIGDLRAPHWIDNQTIVGMRDRDNGIVYTESSIVAANLSGVEQTLTDSDVIAMFPSASADGSKIAFSTPEGNLYVININR